MVYAFAILDGKTFKIVEFDSTVDLGANQFYSKFVDLKKKNPSLKTTIAIGGWDDSHNGTKYSDMVASSANRKTFVDSVVAFLELYKFDGLDIDWEYPSSESDKVGLAELMKELRAEFDLRTPKYLLTIAVGVNKTISELGQYYSKA
jgi:chitinase